VFFTAWSALVFIVRVAAFGQDLFPALVRSERAQNTGSHEPVNPAESAR
jgi:hypothetical protein